MTPTPIDWRSAITRSVDGLDRSSYVFIGYKSGTAVQVPAGTQELTRGAIIAGLQSLGPLYPQSELDAAVQAAHASVDRLCLVSREQGKREACDAALGAIDKERQAWLRRPQLNGYCDNPAAMALDGCARVVAAAIFPAPPAPAPAPEKPFTTTDAKRVIREQGWAANYSIDDEGTWWWFVDTDADEPGMIGEKTLASAVLRAMKAEGVSRG